MKVQILFINRILTLLKNIEMKTLLTFLSFTVFSMMLFVSCENKTELTQNYISGSIDSYDPTSFDSILCMDYKIDSVTSIYTNYHKVGNVVINSTGKFSAVLTAPLNKHTILSRIEGNFSISDSTVYIGYLRLQAYKNGKAIGYVIKCSDGFYTTTAFSNYSSMIYVNKNVTINGTFYHNQNSMTYNLNLKKGWNEVIYTYTYILQSDNKYNMGLTISNTTNEHLKWRFIKYN